MNGVIVVTNTDRDEAKTLLEDTWRNFQLDYESSLFRFVRRAWRERNQEEKWPRGILEREVQDFARPFFLAVSNASRTTDKANERLLVANLIIFFYRMRIFIFRTARNITWS